MKYLKYSIIFFSIIIVTIIVLLMMTISNSKKNNVTINTNRIVNDDSDAQSNMTTIDIPEDDDEYEVETKIENTLSFVSNRSNYFTIKNIYDKYINLIGNEENIVLYNMLSSEYKKQYNINENNILNNTNIPELTNSSQYYKTRITEMLTAQIDEKNSLYIVNGNCRVVNMADSTFSLKLAILVDSINELYYIYPEQYINDKEYDKLIVGDKISFSVEVMTNNKDNKYQRITKTDKEVAEIYFNDYKELLNNYPNEAYSKLNAEYAKKRFNTQESFNKYILESKSMINFANIAKYTAVSKNNYTDYICTDQYNNYYIFRQQNGIMRYSVFLDSYTIELETFKTAYEEGDANSKISSQIDKFRQMINMRDYNAIYSKLNAVFKQNNFNDVQSLKEYLQNTVYEINDIEIDDSYLNEDYYICECTLRNSKNTNEDKKINIIIKLINYNDFEISFNFEEQQ